jgi:hypothetical protein
MKFFQIMLIALMLVGMAGGCSLRSVAQGNSYLGEEYPVASINTVAEHLAETLAAAYPPGHTVLFIEEIGNKHDELGPALESSLRARGFTILPDNSSPALTLAYVLDRLDDEIWYSRISLSDGLLLTRTWHLIGDSLEMEAATSRNERKQQTENGHVQ